MGRYVQNGYLLIYLLWFVCGFSNNIIGFVSVIYDL